MTPGPTNVPPRVREALARRIPHHRSPDFEPIFEQCIAGLGRVFRTKNPVAIFAGSGTLAMEAALAGLLSPGDRVVTLEAGKFGQRWGEIARAHGLDVLPVEAEWGRNVDLAEVERALKANPEVRAVYGTLCETSTAVLSDVEQLGEIVGRSDAILVVDAVSGLAADRLETDDWGVDVAIGGSQKGLMLPPGLAFATISPKAAEFMKSASCPVYYASFKKALRSLEQRTTPFTPAISLIAGLNEALAMIDEEGIVNVWARHERLAGDLRSGGRALGLTLFSKAPSNAVVAFELPVHIAYKDLSAALRSGHGLTIAGGQDRLKGKIFRMAALGWVGDEDVRRALSALELTLRALAPTAERT
ncbi:alanine--glyoxylate aminotransferase family protein [Candidatus Sumerlaeota bacterium]|nr:alanine--glyoxylate aminotransferase family protein [Candidatus Sumerlaeota bacterium]